MRAAHVNAGWPADFDGDGARGVSDHDPQIARFRSRAPLTVSDVTRHGGAAEDDDAGDLHGEPVAAAVAADRWCARRRWDVTAQDGSRTTTGWRSARPWPPGATSLTFTVTVKGDNKKEADERFQLLVAGLPFVQLADPVGVGTITNDD